MIKEANELFNKAEQIRQLLVEYNQAMDDLIVACDNKATAHQIVVNSSSVFKSQVDRVQTNIKHALEFVDRTMTSQHLNVAGFELKSYNYEVKQTPVYQITDQSDKAWAHVLKTCAEINAKAIQKRLSNTAFTDPKTGSDLMRGCLGLVAVKMNSTTSITKK